MKTYKILKYFMARIAKYIINKNKTKAEIICTKLSSGGIYVIKLEIPTTLQNIN